MSTSSDNSDVHHGVYSGTHWTDDDIAILQDLLVHHVSIERIATTLGRTPRAVMHAMRKLFFQQMVTYSPDQVAAFYGVDKSSLVDFLVQNKYDKPLAFFERTRIYPSTRLDRVIGGTFFLLLFSAIGWFIRNATSMEAVTCKA